MNSKKHYNNRRLVVVFWNLSIGGIQTRLRDVVKVALKRGAKVTILLERRSSQEIDLPLSTNLKIYNFRDVKYKEFKRPFKRLDRFRFLVWIAWKVFLIQPTNVLVFLNRFSFFLVIIRIILRFWGRNWRLVLNEGIVTSKYLEQYESESWKNMVKWTYPLADMVIVPTRAVANDLDQNFGIAKNKIKIIRSWVTNNITIKNKKTYDGIFVGRLSPEKGIVTIIKLAKIIKKREYNYKIAVVGDGVLKEYLISEIKKWKLQKIIIYLGYKKHEQVLKTINESRLLLLPSTNEGLPMTVLEAKSMGVPAIVKPFSGVEEVVIDEFDGVITKDSDINFVLETEKLLGDKNKIENMGKEARRQAEKKFSKRNLEKFVDEIFN